MYHPSPEFIRGIFHCFKNCVSNFNFRRRNDFIILLGNSFTSIKCACFFTVLCFYLRFFSRNEKVNYLPALGDYESLSETKIGSIRDNKV